MTDREITGITDRPLIVNTLARAFQDDPALSWIFPNPVERAKRLRRLFNIIVPLDLGDGLCLGAQGGEVVSLWRAPGKAHIPFWQMAVRLPCLLHSFGTALPRALAVSEEIDAHHPKSARFLYLHYIGAVPEHQGKGWGGAALRGGIAEARRHNLPILLETATPANVGLYQSHGFQTIHEWDAPKGGPHFWTMWRPAEPTS